MRLWGVLDLDQSTLSHRITDALPSPWFARAQAVSREEIDTKMNKGEYVFVLEFHQIFNVMFWLGVRLKYNY